MRRTLQAADIAGIRAFAVHAKDESARSFYEHFGFIPSASDPLHLFILIKDLRTHQGNGQGREVGATSTSLLSIARASSRRRALSISIRLRT